MGESSFSRVEGESVENVLDRINKIDRIGDSDFNRVDRVERVDGSESGFGRGGAECAKNVLDRINKIDRIGDDENPDNPVNPVKKTLHVSTRSTRLKNTSAPLRLCVKNNSVYSASSVVKNITQTA